MYVSARVGIAPYSRTNLLRLSLEINDESILPSSGGFKTEKLNSKKRFSSLNPQNQVMGDDCNSGIWLKLQRRLICGELISCFHKYNLLLRGQFYHVSLGMKI